MAPFEVKEGEYYRGVEDATPAARVKNYTPEPLEAKAAYDSWRSARLSRQKVNGAAGADSNIGAKFFLVVKDKSFLFGRTEANYQNIGVE